MTTVVLKPHLTAEMYDICFDKFCTNRWLTEKKVRKAIQVAWSSKLALRRFLSAVSRNLRAHVVKKKIVMFNINGFFLTRCDEWLMMPFTKFCSEVSFCEVSSDSSDEDWFIRRLEDMNDLREMDLSCGHEIEDDLFPKIANVFARLINLKVDLDTFVTILEKTDARFPKLERLKIVGSLQVVGGRTQSHVFENIALSKIVTTVERFPALQFLEIVWTSWHKKFEDLTFAENPFPTVKTLNIIIYEEVDQNVPVRFHFERILTWLKKFPSLKKAEILVNQWFLNDATGDSEREQRAQSVFRSTDFCNELDITFEIKSLNTNYRWLYRLPPIRK